MATLVTNDKDYIPRYFHARLLTQETPRPPGLSTRALSLDVGVPTLALPVASCVISPEQETVSLATSVFWKCWGGRGVSY